MLVLVAGDSCVLLVCMHERQTDGRGAGVRRTIRYLEHPETVSSGTKITYIESNESK